jgi:hypothetical protein
MWHDDGWQNGWQNDQWQTHQNWQTHGFGVGAHQPPQHLHFENRDQLLEFVAANLPAADSSDSSDSSSDDEVDVHRRHRHRTIPYIPPWYLWIVGQCALGWIRGAKTIFLIVRFLLSRILEAFTGHVMITTSSALATMAIATAVYYAHVLGFVVVVVVVVAEQTAVTFPQYLNITAHPAAVFPAFVTSVAATMLNTALIANSLIVLLLSAIATFAANIWLHTVITFIGVISRSIEYL